MGRSLPGRRRAAARSVLAPGALPGAASAATGRRDRAAAAAANDRGRDRRGARAAAVDRLVVVEADREWGLRPPRRQLTRTHRRPYPTTSTATTTTDHTAASA